MTSQILSPDDIPTISMLYESGFITASTSSGLPTPVQNLNDRISTIRHDITKLKVDVVVNAANRHLLPGSGVDNAIHRAAGIGLHEECRALGNCKFGSAKITDAYALPCGKIIHAVGPDFLSADQPELLLRSCYRTALNLAVANGCKSIAFCTIATGYAGYPSDQAADVALRETRKFLTSVEESRRIERIIFCTYTIEDVRAYKQHIP